MILIVNKIAKYNSLPIEIFRYSKIESGLSPFLFSEILFVYIWCFQNHQQCQKNIMKISKSPKLFLNVKNVEIL
jgi:hypothetical protein